ncbi:MAG: RNA polymerase sigma factor [bacterium]
MDILGQIEPDVKKNEARDDVLLVTEALKNPDAFSHIMHKYLKPLKRYVHRLANLHEDEDEDLMQDIFIKIYKNLNDFDSNLSFSSWIYRVSHNATIDHIRKMKNRPRLALNDDDEDRLLSVADELDIVKESDKLFLSKHINEIFSGMKDDHRIVLTLKYFEDRDYAEISDILKKPPGTVATLIHRAKVEFKKIVTERKLNSNEL